MCIGLTDKNHKIDSKKDLLCSTGNCIQCITCSGKDTLKYIHD